MSIETVKTIMLVGIAIAVAAWFWLGKSNRELEKRLKKKRLPPQKRWNK